MKLIERIRSSRKRTLVLLLLSIFLVGTVSAAVYYQLSNQSAITISKALVNFCTTSCAGATSAADYSAAGATLGTNQTYVKLTSIKAYPNATAVYEQAVGIQNLDSSSHNLRLRDNGITGTSANWQTISFKITDAAGNIKSGPLTYTGGGSFTNNSPTSFSTGLPASTTWFVRVEATAIASNSITSGTVATINLFVEVQ